MKRRKTQKEMWDYINEPKNIGLPILFSRGKITVKIQTVDRVPRIKRNRKKQK